jgi:hypothetical protein
MQYSRTVYGSVQEKNQITMVSSWTKLVKRLGAPNYVGSNQTETIFTKTKL